MVLNQPSENDETESETWTPQKEVNRLLNSLDENETDFNKIADVAHKSLKAMSLGDACEYMIRHELPMNDENIVKFLHIAQEAYIIRLGILENLLSQNVRSLRLRGGALKKLLFKNCWKTY